MIDAHAHIWAVGSPEFGWLDRTPFRGDPRWDPIRKTFPPEALARLLAVEGIDGAVLVESADLRVETDALLKLADEHDWVFGVVGWLPLLDPQAFAAAIDRYRDIESLVGVRHLINSEPDPEWILQPPVIDSLRRLAEVGLTFDYVGARIEQLAVLPRLADACPDTTIVLDHLNNPPIAEGMLHPWAELLTAAAERPNVVAKISGLDMCSRWWAWTAVDWRPFVDHALAVFGAKRLMLGGNWPVSTLSSHYHDIWATYRNLLAKLSATEHNEISSGTARRVYGRGRVRGRQDSDPSHNR